MGGDINTAKTTDMVGERFGRSRSECILRSREPVCYATHTTKGGAGAVGGEQYGPIIITGDGSRLGKEERSDDAEYRNHPLKPTIDQNVLIHI